MSPGQSTYTLFAAKASAHGRPVPVWAAVPGPLQAAWADLEYAITAQAAVAVAAVEAREKEALRLLAVVGAWLSPGHAQPTGVSVPGADISELRSLLRRIDALVRRQP